MLHLFRDTITYSIHAYQNLEKKKVDILSYIFPDNVTIKEKSIHSLIMIQIKPCQYKKTLLNETVPLCTTVFQSCVVHFNSILRPISIVASHFAGLYCRDTVFHQHA